MKITNDLADQYDLYYKGGDESIYNKRFGKSLVIPSEALAIKSSLIRVIKKNYLKTKITILDFGCGNGRLFQTVYSIISLPKYQHLCFEFIAYDPSNVGLTHFSNLLLKQGFKHTTNFSSSNTETKQGFISHILEHTNILVKFIQANTEDDIGYIQNLLGNEIDLTLCMFGVLSHIPNKSNRRNILKMFNDTLAKNGELILSLPTAKSFPDELIAYNKLREQYRISLNDCYDKALRLAKEEGDLYYCKFDDNIVVNNFCHMYKIKELKADITSSHIKLKSPVKILSIKHPFELSDNYIYAIYDFVLSSILSYLLPYNNIKERLAKHIIVICEKGL